MDRIGLLGLVLVVVNTWPLAPRLADVGRADSYDGQYGLWQAAWVARALVTDPLHVYDANIFYPHRTTLAFSEPTLLAGILGLPAYLATHSPYATHNLAVLGFFFLSFCGAFALGRYLTGAMWPSLALGIAYAFSPYMFARSAQLPMMAIFGLPFAALAMHRLVERPSARAAAGVAAALVLQALGCGYYTVFALLVVGAGFVYFGALSGRWRDRAYLRACGLAAGLSAAALAPLFWPHLSLAEGQGFSRPVAEAYRFAADWRAWFASSAWAHRWMLPLLGSWNEVLFPGFIPVIFAGAAAWLGLRGSLTGPRRAASTGEIAAFYLLLAVLSIWLAFGPAGGLYTVLYESVPLFAFIRAAGRFGVVTTLATAALMAMMLGHLGPDRPRAAIRRRSDRRARSRTVLGAAAGHAGPARQPRVSHARGPGARSGRRVSDGAAAARDQRPLRPDVDGALAADRQRLRRLLAGRYPAVRPGDRNVSLGRGVRGRAEPRHPLRRRSCQAV